VLGAGPPASTQPHGAVPGRDWAECGRCAGATLVVMSDTSVSPVRSEPTLDGDHERMAHIVLEGWKPEEGDFVSAGPSVVEGLVNGTAVKALCGKVWVPSRDPKKYPLCPTCKEVAESLGWKVPAF
jgi:Protein of unknown function (DUF3039)